MDHTNKSNRIFFAKRCLIILPILLLCNWAYSADIVVKSLVDLQASINKARPGDRILLANGVYNSPGEITVKVSGTAKQPITIAAQNLAGAEITGAAGFNIVDSASHIIIWGFRFTHRSNRAKSGPLTSFCKWSHNIFQTHSMGDNLQIAGNDHEIDYNSFTYKNAFGRFLAVRGKDNQISQRLWVHHNYFKVFMNQGGGNGAEALQFGLSNFSLSTSNSIVEHNLFEECAGETELISIKASGVVLRYNTIRDCPAQFTLRHGNKCEVYGNYFFNTPGIRIFGDDHLVYSNYFEDCDPAINIGSGDAEVSTGGDLASHDKPDRVFIAFNTLVNNKTNITMRNRTDGLGASAITIAYNIIQGGPVAASIKAPYRDSVWKGNIIHKVKAGDMPSSSYKETDPLLSQTGKGYFAPAKKSPVINSVAEQLPAIKFDLDGQPRVVPLDAGADEYASSAVKAKILLPADVGFFAGKK